MVIYCMYPSSVCHFIVLSVCPWSDLPALDHSSVFVPTLLPQSHYNPLHLTLCTWVLSFTFTPTHFLTNVLFWHKLMIYYLLGVQFDVPFGYRPSNNIFISKSFACGLCQWKYLASTQTESQVLNSVNLSAQSLMSQCSVGFSSF